MAPQGKGKGVGSVNPPQKNRIHPKEAAKITSSMQLFYFFNLHQNCQTLIKLQIPPIVQSYFCPTAGHVPQQLRSAVAIAENTSTDTVLSYFGNAL